MSPEAVFFIQALIAVCVPYLVWQSLNLRRLVPLVIVQILLGIMLGPSVTGRWFPEVWAVFFAGEKLTALSGASWLAVVLFAFLTGLHLQPAQMKSLGRPFAAISVSSILAPTLLGCLAGWWLALRHPDQIGPNASLWQFSLAIGLSAGVTALPVLAAILRELGLLHHRIGLVSLSMAAINDAVLWVTLGLLLIGVPNANHPAVDPWLIPALALVYGGFMFYLVRPVLSGGIKGKKRLAESSLVLVCATIFGSALIAELIGLHATLGGFVAGVIVPRRAARAIIERMEPITVVVLLPFFFTQIGLTVNVDLDAPGMGEILVISTVATVLGKLGGTAVTARWVGEPLPVALALGILMQTKGMMEVVVLTILFQTGLIATTCYSALLLMAILTTTVTTPLLRWSLRAFPLPVEVAPHPAALPMRPPR